MKHISRIILVLALLMGCTTYVDAQRKYNKYKSVTIGVKGGVTLSKVNFRPSVKEGFLLGMNVGASVRYIEDKYFGIIGEINLAQYGWQEDFSKQAIPGDYSYSHTLNYITVPLLSHIFFGNEPMRFFINLGPQIGICISDKVSSSFDIYDLPHFSPTRETQQYFEPLNSRFDYGITGGLGLELKMKKHSVVVEARYYFGLNDFFENSKGKAAYFSASANQQISAGIAYLFQVK